MSLRRLRGGELLALVGLVGIFACLWLDWFKGQVIGAVNTDAGLGNAVLRSNTLTGWDGFGWGGLVLVGAGLVLALMWLLVTVLQQSPAFPVAGAMWTCVGALVELLAIAARLILPPDHTDTRWPAFAALGCALLLLAGAFASLRDERTAAKEAASPEVELRPVPGR